VPAVVLTDHEAQYVNKFYGSRLDNLDNINKDQGTFHIYTRWQT